MIFKLISQKIKEVFSKMRLTILRTPPDIIGVGVTSSLVGRTFLYGAFGISFMQAQLPIYAVAFALVLTVDITLHLLALREIKNIIYLDERAIYVH